MSLKNLAQRALDVQDACNLSGVVHSWVKAIAEIKEKNPEVSILAINRHPINVLFANKVADLAGSDCVPMVNNHYRTSPTLS